MAAWRELRLRSVASSTFNRECNCLSAIFTTAVKEWKWLKSNPLTNLKRTNELPPRSRIITEAEADLICLWLGEDGLSNRVRLAFLFALKTGMRAGEICGLKKNDVAGSMARLMMTKNGKSRQVSLSGRARKILLVASKIDASDLSCFGLSASQLDSLFRKARDALSLDCVFHDTRHIAATRLAQKLNLLELCAMFGFKPDVAQRVYVNLNALDIAKKL